MLQLKTFKMGGIHPPEEKHAAARPIIYGKIPQHLLVPVDQHIGKPTKIIVKKGDVVERGQLIAEATGFVSSNVHAPLAGKVQKVMKFPLLGGQIKEVVQITPDAAGEGFDVILNAESTQKLNVDDLAPDEIKKKISAAGIIGMGGAGFPTNVKLSPPAEKPIDALIINGAECEPYITSDHRLMLEKSSELIKGIQILQKLFSAVKVYIGIEENKPDAIETLEAAAKSASNIEVIALKTKYPQGGEKQLIRAITGREVPSKGLPMDVGVVVQNVATMGAIHDVFYYDRPLTERVLTIAGNLVSQPENIVLPNGTPISHIMELFEIDPNEVKALINGGPMMGRTSYSLESPIGKTTSALLFFDENHIAKREENPCIRCGSCIEACPMGLPVAQVTQYVKAGELDEESKDFIMDCIECGSCSYVCPADRKLVHWMRLGKNLIRRES
jgi:electron transport complex protein RnfC